MRDQILVPFEGPGEGIEVLSWGQKGMWQTIQREGKSVAMSGLTPLPAGTTVPYLITALQFLLSRHQSLRTRLVFDADGGVRQAVSSSGVATLDIVDAGQADPARVAALAMDEMQNRAYDYVNEWPLRAAAIRSNGEITHLAAVYLHLALDAFGLDVLLADLATMDPTTGRSSAPVTGMSPMEQARWQQTPAAQRQCDASLRHLEKVLRSVPAQRFPGPVSDAPPEYPTLIFRSPATRLAVSMIARRKNMDTSQVLLGLYGVAVARLTGNNPFVTMLAVSNRFRPGLADSVSMVAQISPCLIDLAGTTLDEAIGRARRAAVSAYKNAYYDPPQRMALIERVTAERGEKVDLSCFFSDRRLDRELADTATVTGQQLEAAVAGSDYRWDAEGERVLEKLYLSVDSDADAITFTMTADTSYLPPAEMITLAQAIEAAAVQAALDENAPSEVQPARAGV